MNGNEDKHITFEIGVVVSKNDEKKVEKGSDDCVEILVKEFENIGLIVESVLGLYEEFLKVAAPLEVLGRAAADLEIKKPTHIGMDLQFEWDEREAFVKQPDGSLFSWCERFRCFKHLIYGIVNKSESVLTLTFLKKKIKWKPGVSLLEMLECEGIVKQVFPLHDEVKRKQLLKSWAFNWMGFTQQPIDEIYSYFGTKIAIYFAFLGMYTRWMLFPAAFSLTLQLVDFGSWQMLMLPIFFIFVTLWAVTFFQFWKRKNSALLARWQISCTGGVDTGFKRSDVERSSIQSHEDHMKGIHAVNKGEKEAFQRDEWLGHLLRFRNDAVVILSIICLQLPFELAYAHLYELMASDILKHGVYQGLHSCNQITILTFPPKLVQIYQSCSAWISMHTNNSFELIVPAYCKLLIHARHGEYQGLHSCNQITILTFPPKLVQIYQSCSAWISMHTNNSFELIVSAYCKLLIHASARFGLTALYLFAIQYLTKIGGKVSVKLIKHERNKSTESEADSLIYKVFGLYFMQTYIGVFYHALLHRNFMTLRQVLTQRLIVSQVFENLLENSIPYLKYSLKKFRAVHKKKHEKGSKSMGKIQVTSRVEKEYLKPTYSASIGAELEDGLFDDFLEIALQFGMIMMFACAFPLAFCFAAFNNITEIRTDALKLLAMLRRPVPRASATIGAWLNIFQFLIVTSICTNCVLLVCLYDQEGKWKVEPGLAAILIIEHALLLIKFGFSKFVPEEPAWVKARRVKNAAHAQDMCSKQLLRTFSGERKKE